MRSFSDIRHCQVWCSLQIMYLYMQSLSFASQKSFNFYRYLNIWYNVDWIRWSQWAIGRQAWYGYLSQHINLYYVYGLGKRFYKIVEFFAFCKYVCVPYRVYRPQFNVRISLFLLCFQMIVRLWSDFYDAAIEIMGKLIHHITSSYCGRFACLLNRVRWRWELSSTMQEGKRIQTLPPTS